MQTHNRTTILDSDPATGTPAARAQRVATTWREPLVRGILAIVVGVVLFAFPISATIVFAIAFGVFVLFDGVFAIIHAVRNPHSEAGTWWAMLARGILGVVVGLFAIVFPTFAAAVLGTIIAIWAIVAGVLEIGAGFRIRHDVPRETTLVIVGALTILLGVVLVFVPLVAIIAQIWLFAAFAIVAGIGLVTYALQLRRRAIAYRNVAITRSPGSF
jgi:uncharacterized membrane protein HdeD (DUF308 family)